MYSSQLIEKLKFGEKYILANIVVVPISKTTEDESSHEFPARNKYLTRDIWQSFVYCKLYDLFRKHLSVTGLNSEKDSPFQMNQEYRVYCPERPYLQMKYEFRDKYFRNSLNILFKEKQAILHENCIYVEISDQGRILFDKVDDRERTVLRLLKEIDELKAANADENKLASCLSSGGNSTGRRNKFEFEEYCPEPVNKQDKKSSVEEYVPLTRNGFSPGTKRAYKPSKITDSGKSASPPEPDPYTPGALDKPLAAAYVPTSSPLNKIANGSPVKGGKVGRNLFGSDDDEYVPADGKAGNVQPKYDSEKDMFADTEPDSPHRSDQPIEGESSENDAVRSSIAKREMLPRSSKLNSRPLLPDSPEEKRKLKFTKKVVASRADENLNKQHLRLKNGIRKKPDQRKESSLRGQGKLEKLSNIAKQLSKVELLDCTSLTKEEILDTFGRYRKELLEIFVRYKDRTERQWKNSGELCYFTDLANVMDDDQKLVMLHHLEEEFVSEQERGKYTEFFTSSLLMEWALRIFMERHKFASRQAALDRIKQQETSYLASLPNEFMLKYH
ncbi:uncharacterized protein LOC131289466 [Anopheles ziemanni]|uniref:uncharacterized protein LOC131272663 n=1 Tax=Anopheles coustani TaxID=139045 RepID=UPI002659D010|nr:uncharacterized protein LOC131272663 [Anopheles coustani]XP_058174715.1 uncharacterized protein LOC131289466 [Anopheles ziemanni]